MVMLTKRLLVWAVRLGPGVLCCHAHTLPSTLATFLRQSLAQHLVCSDESAARLVDELLAVAPEGSQNAFCQQQGRRVAHALERDATLRRELLDGDLSVSGVLAELDERQVSAKKMFDAIQGHHAHLRTLVGQSEGGTAASDWRAAIGDQDNLRRYAAAADQIATREWTQQGIDWCAAQAVDFFHEGGMARLLRKEARQRTGSRWVSDEEKAAIESATAGLGAARAPIRLLDVGSCGSLFDGVDGLDVTAIDLCPKPGLPHVHQADFLALEVGPAGSPPVAEPHPEYPAGSLRRLAANSSDALVMSLVLSYLPQPSLRAAMVAKARRLLRAPSPAEPLGARGVLLIHETLALDKKSHTQPLQSNVRAWVDAIERLGFVHLRHATLKRSHGLAFATRPLAASELDALLEEASLPELLLRRETQYGDDAQPWQRSGRGGE